MPQRVQRLCLVQRPDLCRAVIRARGQVLALVVPLDGIDLVQVALEVSDGCVRAKFAQVDDAIGGARCEARLVLPVHVQAGG